MTCGICGRTAESDLCKLHEEARTNLSKSYEAWRKAMNISWTEYLKEIGESPYAGIWVKEVAQHLLASSSSEELPTGEERGNV